ncbi:outer membrane autotransporter [Teratosphaeria destructans]|uniref:Outer membrane autotransporter n=1 Tax=Teratosphaeria destructans TaxID=418781 RepID=A0A9W7W1F4_9PEZI|nr:outer membrane autotransporter [Teratosphaeria destructans]
MYITNSIKAIAPIVLMLASAASTTLSPTATAVNTTTCNGKTYVYQELAGYGYIPSNATDIFGDTIGGIGSSIAIDRTTWGKVGNQYKGLLWALPDRGWNTQGTLNFQNRVHKIEITFTPNESATVTDPSPANLQLQYLDTILFTDPNFQPTSGLDANVRGPYLTFPNIPFDLPSVHYTGDGFGGSGTGGHRVAVDSEGLFLAHDGTFWVSDEYGPYLYHFDAVGHMIGAIRPPNAFIPLRNSSESFSADSPPIYDPALVPIPTDNPTGRDDNQGFEGLTTNPAGTRLYALMQSALNQEGGLKNKNSRNARFVIYDITQPQPTIIGEYVVPESHVTPSDSTSKVAHQSEIHYISDTQFLILARDSNAGRGQSSTQSIYRDVDIFDISDATNVADVDHYNTYTGQIADASGDLFANVTPAAYCRWLDYNVNSQLNRFGLHNGGAQDASLLNEKWESLALMPVNPGSDDEEYYLFTLSDNDFITQDGHLNFGRYHYADDSGYNVQNQALVFQVKLPAGVAALVG